MTVKIKRIYDPVSKADGVRILVDRLWPRGVSKNKAKVDRWLRDIAPSAELRRWFGHEPDKWDEFRRRYFAELDDNELLVADIQDAAATGVVTLLFSARDVRFNNAAALRDYLIDIQ